MEVGLRREVGGQRPELRRGHEEQEDIPLLQCGGVCQGGRNLQAVCAGVVRQRQDVERGNIRKRRFLHFQRRMLGTIDVAVAFGRSATLFRR